MVCLGIEPGAAGWKARTNPLSYGGTPGQQLFCVKFHYAKLKITLTFLCRIWPREMELIEYDALFRNLWVI